VLTQPERGIWAYGMSGSLWFNFPIFNMYGMEMVRYDATGRASAALDTPAGLAALERMRAIAASGVEGGAWKRSALFPDAGFINRKYAMILTGPWMVENFTNAGLDFDVALIPGPTAAEAAALGLAPRAPGRVAELGPLAWSSSNVGGQTGVVLKTCARPEVAFELLDYFTSEAVQRRWASGLGQIPVRLAAWRDLDTRKYPFMPKFMEQLALAQRTPQIPLYGRLENDIFNPEVDLLLQRPGYPARTMLQNMERGMREKILAPINEGIDAAGRAPLERQGS
jgi:ABC-type glycerol-3-phosphate transport system substrate-binding protein